MAKKLGYTWYSKDWRSSKRVFRLTLQERGFYRELIDEAYSRDNRVSVELDLWVREFGCSENELLDMLKKFETIKDEDGISLIKIKGDVLSIPSCEPRLNLSRGGKNGGEKTQKNKQELKPVPKPTSKPNVNPTPKQREREREREIFIDENIFIDIWKRARLFYDKKQTGFDNLLQFEKQCFKQLLNDGFTKQDFEFAVAGLFFQKTVPAVRVRPDWLLKPENFTKMLDCWKNQNKLFDDTKQEKEPKFKKGDM